MGQDHMCFRGIFGFQRELYFPTRPNVIFFATNTHRQNLLYFISVQNCQNILEIQSATAKWPHVISISQKPGSGCSTYWQVYFSCTKCTNPRQLRWGYGILEGAADGAGGRDSVVAKVHNSPDELWIYNSFATQSFSEPYTTVLKMPLTSLFYTDTCGVDK